MVLFVPEASVILIVALTIEIVRLVPVAKSTTVPLPVTVTVPEPLIVFALAPVVSRFATVGLVAPKASVPWVTVTEPVVVRASAVVTVMPEPLTVIAEPNDLPLLVQVPVPVTLRLTTD